MVLYILKLGELLQGPGEVKETLVTIPSPILGRKTVWHEFRAHSGLCFVGKVGSGRD